MKRYSVAGFAGGSGGGLPEQEVEPLWTASAPDVGGWPERPTSPRTRNCAAGPDGSARGADSMDRHRTPELARFLLVRMLHERSAANYSAW